MKGNLFPKWAGSWTKNTQHRQYGEKEEMIKVFFKKNPGQHLKKEIFPESDKNPFGNLDPRPKLKLR